MATSLRLTKTITAREIVEWFLSLLSPARHGFVQLPDGNEFVVLRPQQLADLNAIISDPAFAEALESGVADALSGRTTRTQDLRAGLLGGMACDASMADSVERAVADIAAKRVGRSRSGESLGAALMRHRSVTTSQSVPASKAGARRGSSSARGPRKRK
ncbi:MAG: hypothetical protein ACKVW3_14175 [Phycisphaerales bacterium]